MSAPHIISYTHTYSFITQNDRTHLHKIKIQVTKYEKSSRVKTVIKKLIRVFEQHAVNKIPFGQLTGDNFSCLSSDCLPSLCQKLSDLMEV